MWIPVRLTLEALVVTITRPPSVEEPQDDAVLVLEGELDILTVGDVRARFSDLLGRGTGPIVLDCARLAFIDASGLGTLVWMANQAGRSGRAISLRGASARTAQVIRWAGLERRLGERPPVPGEPSGAAA